MVDSERRGTWVYYRVHKQALDLLGGILLTGAQAEAAPAPRPAPPAPAAAPVHQEALISADPDVVRLLADPLRARIVELLAGGPATTSHLVTDTGAKQPNVSGHLKQLREAGVVTAEPRGRFTYYRLVPETLQGAALHLADLAADARANCDTFRDYLPMISTTTAGDTSPAGRRTPPAPRLSPAPVDRPGDDRRSAAGPWRLVFVAIGTTRAASCSRARSTWTTRVNSRSTTRAPGPTSPVCSRPATWSTTHTARPSPPPATAVPPHSTPSASSPHSWNSDDVGAAEPVGGRGDGPRHEAALQNLPMRPGANRIGPRGDNQSAGIGSAATRPRPCRRPRRARPLTAWRSAAPP